MFKVPPDVITDIFRQLPVKTLVRFLCLSKPLYSLIYSRDFIELHLNHSIKTRSNFSVFLKDWNLYTIDFDTLTTAVEFTHPLQVGGGTEIVGSCNGLIALRNSERDLALYNPSTRKLKRLPVSEVNSPRDLRTGYVFYGFGYDSVNDDYKVVRMASFVSEDDECHVFGYDYEVKVYSLKRDSWKVIKDLPYYLRFLNKPFYHVLHKRGYGVLAGNALHWVLPQRPEFGLRNSIIIAFDIGLDVFFEVPQPDYEKNYKSLNFQVDVGVLEGCLCVMCNCEHACVDVWVMKEYKVKESWSKLFSVERIRTTNVFAFLKPLAYSKDGNEVLLEVNDGKLVWYDWNRGSAKSLRIHGAPKSFGAEMYVGSLVPLDDDGETERKKKKQEQEEKEKSNANGKKRDDFLSVGFKLKL